MRNRLLLQGLRRRVVALRGGAWKCGIRSQQKPDRRPQPRARSNHGDGHAGVYIHRVGCWHRSNGTIQSSAVVARQSQPGAHLPRGTASRPPPSVVVFRTSTTPATGRRNPFRRYIYIIYK